VLGCKPASTSIDQKSKLSAEADESIDKVPAVSGPIDISEPHSSRHHLR
jgi:hypothetical protein